MEHRFKGFFAKVLSFKSTHLFQFLLLLIDGTPGNAFDRCEIIQYQVEFLSSGAIRHALVHLIHVHSGLMHGFVREIFFQVRGHLVRGDLAHLETWRETRRSLFYMDIGDTFKLLN